MPKYHNKMSVINMFENRTISYGTSVHNITVYISLNSNILEYLALNKSIIFKLRFSISFVPASQQKSYGNSTFQFTKNFAYSENVQIKILPLPHQRDRIVSSKDLSCI